MTATISQDTFLEQVNALLDETFEQVQGIFLDKGTSLFETLEQISSAEASTPVSPRCASLAAQTRHVEFYLQVLEHYIFAEDAGQVDWGEIWRTTREVTPAEWDEIRSTLKTTYTHLRSRLNELPSWDNERPLGGVLAIITHTAYHLGEIRQATCILKQ